MFDLVSGNYMIQMADRGMTLASRRMTLIAGNLANIDTPNYRTQDFSFEDAFQQQMAALDRQFSPSTEPLKLPSRFPDAAARTTPAPSTSSSVNYERNDLNDVNLDQQTMLLARTQEMYQLSSNFAQLELRKVLGAIRDGAK
jgi:flagellar basal-body rod protein FlgB